MTFTRAAAYVGSGALLVAWFAVAGSAPDQDAVRAGDRPRTVATSGPASLADEVQAQGVRLRERLAEAPAPGDSRRNPFSFAAVPAPRAGTLAPSIAAAVVEPPPVSVAPPPPLSLMGVAEEPSPEGVHRTAVIALRQAQGDEIYMVVEGQTFADRYKVTAIGVDAIELKDVTTGGYRRLALR